MVPHFKGFTFQYGLLANPTIHSYSACEIYGHLWALVSSITVLYEKKAITKTQKQQDPHLLN